MLHVLAYKSGSSSSFFPAGITHGVPADNIVNATIDGLDSRAFVHLFDGVTWDRARTSDATGASIGATGIIAAGIVGTDGANFSAIAFRPTTDANSLANSLAAAPFWFNGTTFDRARNNSAVAISQATQPFALMVSGPGQWGQASTPAANNQATTTKAAGGAGVRHVCETVSFSVFATGALGPIQVNLRDGATGAGTILWSMTVQLAAGQFASETISGLRLFGTANTAMTLEFSAGPGATNIESVSISGHSTT